MFYVYLLRSERDPRQRYVGYTGDLKRRIGVHNDGGSPHTAKYKPWTLVAYQAFSEKDKAQAFERYLKTGSGQAFANKRLW
ncbi:GIY-YIG nuclease family protein [Amorphus coralli]|uniref:GIY-YIG nuclease family protein n=1 Tax=Amorphus coralli TaxID=340680 RepID=UPI00037451B2|nr:GIY-YIG nuclease family protein [Amorphus coralli]